MICHIAIKAALILSIVQVAMATPRLVGLAVLFVLYEYSFSDLTGAEDEISKRVLDPPQDEDFRRTILNSVNNDEGRFRPRTAQWKPRRQKRPLLDPSKTDLVFILDKSSSIGPVNFNLEKRFVQELISYLPIFPIKTRLAAVSFSSRVKLEFNFKKYINKECTIKGIQNIRYTGGRSTIGHSLDLVRVNVIFNSAAGARNNAQKIVVAFTDGKPNTVERIPSYELKRAGIAIIVVGVTKRASTQKLLSIASEPQYVFHIDNSNALSQLIELLGGDSSRKCRPGQIVYDECGRQCKCVKGKLVGCCRVRKQFTEMSVSERVRYVAVVKEASTNPAYKENYERLLTIHKTFFNSDIHQATYFLPWHRWFILQYENLLREIDCRITIPYWESAEEANDALSSDVWNTGSHGFGGNGSAAAYCVLDGPFRAGEWSVIPSAGGGCLTRNFNGRYPDCLTVRDAFLEFSNASQFHDFEYFLHREFHDAVHCVIGGLMCTDNSASSPEFFLHHGFVDKLWSDWQKQSNEHMFSQHFTSQTTQMPTTKYLSKEFLDLFNQPGCACVEYRDPGDEIYKTVTACSKKQVKEIPRVAPPPYPDRARELFKLSDEDMKHLERIRKLLKPLHLLHENDLDGQNRILGFRIEDLERTKATLPSGSIPLKPKRFRRSGADEEVKDFIH